MTGENFSKPKLDVVSFFFYHKEFVITERIKKKKTILLRLTALLTYLYFGITWCMNTCYCDDCKSVSQRAENRKKENV